MTEDDVRRVLELESADISDAAELVSRMQTARGGRARMVWHAAVVSVVVALLAAVAAVEGVRHIGTGNQSPAAPSPSQASIVSSPTPTLDVSLQGAPALKVTSTDLDRNRQVLYVAYQPTAQVSYEGGAVTLLGRGAFDGPAYVRSADRLSVRGHPAYLGAYPYLGQVGSVTTLAWPVSGGRWVLVQNFRGIGDGNDPRMNRVAETMVADAVRVS